MWRLGSVEQKLELPWLHPKIWGGQQVDWTQEERPPKNFYSTWDYSHGAEQQGMSFFPHGQVNFSFGSKILRNRSGDL